MQVRAIATGSRRMTADPAAARRVNWDLGKTTSRAHCVPDRARPALMPPCHSAGKKPGSCYMFNPVTSSQVADCTREDMILTIWQTPDEKLTYQDPGNKWVNQWTYNVWLDQQANLQSLCQLPPLHGPRRDKNYGGSENGVVVAGCSPSAIRAFAVRQAPSVSRARRA